MRDFLKYLIAPILALVVGGLVVGWWVSNNPETEVYYDYNTQTIPANIGMTFDSFTEIRVWNPSKRVRAENIHLEIQIPTGSDPEVGQLQTPEPENTIHVGVAQKRPGFKTVTLTAERLAPGSGITGPLWWLSRGEQPLVVDGSCDQCVIVRRERTSAGDMERTELATFQGVLLVLAAAVVMTFLSFTRYSHRRQTDVTSSKLEAAIDKLLEERNSLYYKVRALEGTLSEMQPAGPTEGDRDPPASQS